LPGTRSPLVARKELGVALRRLRAEQGWTVEQVAQRLLCSPSKVSRMETGQRGASARDVRDLCDLYRVGNAQRERLTRLASEGKQRPWGQPLGLPYSTYVGLEAEASVIRDFGIGAMPGLLQTSDYARQVVRAAAPRWAPGVVDQRVTGRVARQQILTSASPPRFEAIIDESVLHRVVGGAAVMAAQLEHLLELSARENIEIRVIPYDAGALPAVNKFIVLGFDSPTVPDVVYIEGLTGDLYLNEIEDVEVYNTTFWALGELAASPDRTRGIIASMIITYRSQLG
jgi:transcriptional regulator with XRE-family HTH domain